MISIRLPSPSKLLSGSMRLFFTLADHPVDGLLRQEASDGVAKVQVGPRHVPNREPSHQNERKRHGGGRSIGALAEGANFSRRPRATQPHLRHRSLAGDLPLEPSTPRHPRRCISFVSSSFPAITRLSPQVSPKTSRALRARYPPPPFVLNSFASRNGLTHRRRRH